MDVVVQSVTCTINYKIENTANHPSPKRVDEKCIHYQHYYYIEVYSSNVLFSKKDKKLSNPQNNQMSTNSIPLNRYYNNNMINEQDISQQTSTAIPALKPRQFKPKRCEVSKVFMEQIKKDNVHGTVAIRYTGHCIAVLHTFFVTASIPQKIPSQKAVELLQKKRANSLHTQQQRLRSIISSIYEAVCCDDLETQLQALLLNNYGVCITVSPELIDTEDTRSVLSLQVSANVSIYRQPLPLKSFQVLNEAKKAGFVCVNTTNILFFGMAGTGKTFTKHLLLGPPPPQNQNSTPLASTAERACFRQIRDTTALKMEDPSRTWKSVTSDNLQRIVADAIKSHVSSSDPNSEVSAIPQDTCMQYESDNSLQSDDEHSETDEQKTPVTCSDQFLYFNEICIELYEAHPKWYDLGLALGLDVGTLDNIDIEHRTCETCLKEVLKQRDNATKLTREEALRQPTVQMNTLADKILKKETNDTSQQHSIASSSQTTPAGGHHLDFSHVYRTLYKASPKWYNIGLALGLGTGTFNIIKHDNKECETCLMKALNKRHAIKRLPLEEIDEALRQPTVEMNTLADEILQERIFLEQSLSTSSSQPSSDPTPECVVRYTSFLKDRYKQMSPFPDDWPPPLKEKFTKLALIERKKQIRLTQAKHQPSIQYDYATGNVDNIVERKKAITLEQIFEPLSDNSEIAVPNRYTLIMVHGAPGVGKTTLSNDTYRLEDGHKDWVSACKLEGETMLTCTVNILYHMYLGLS